MRRASIDRLGLPGLQSRFDPAVGFGFIQTRVSAAATVFREELRQKINAVFATLGARHDRQRATPNRPADPAQKHLAGHMIVVEVHEGREHDDALFDATLAGAGISRTDHDLVVQVRRFDPSPPSNPAPSCP